MTHWEAEPRPFFFDDITNAKPTLTANLIVLQASPAAEMEGSVEPEHSKMLRYIKCRALMSRYWLINSAERF